MLPTLLLAALLGQSASTIAGAAMGPNNQPVGQALIYISEGPADDGSVPALGQGMTDAQGRYRLEVGKRTPTLSVRRYQAVVFAYRSGMALAGSALGVAGAERDPRALQVTLEPAVARTLKLTDLAGRGLANVRVAPLQVSPGGPNAPRMAIPEALGDRLAVKTDANGQAVLGYLAPKYEVQALRVTVPSGASHVLEVPPGLYVSNPLSLVLDLAGRLAGRVLTEDGKPAAGVEVEVVPNLRSSNFGLWKVRFKGGPVRAGDDGRFVTPPGLLLREEYRVLVKADEWEQKGFAPVTLSKDPAATTTYPDIVLTPKRVFAGRVVDRRGHAVADAEIVVNTYGRINKARSQTQGRFRVPEVASGRAAVLVVRAEGYCPFGRVVNEREGKDLEVVLTRRDETPAPVMKTLPSSLPEAERRKLARQVLQPFLDKAFAEGNDTDKSWALQALLAIDLNAALELLDKTTFASQNDRAQGFLRIQIVQHLAKGEPDRAAQIARAIKDPYPRATSLLELARLLPAEHNDHKKELIHEALPAAHEVAKADERVFLLAWAAGELMDLGDKKQAEALAAEVRESLEKAANPAGSFFTSNALVRLGRVDLSAARVILEKQVAESDRPRILGNIAAQLAASDPAEAERLLEAVKTLPSRFSISLRTCYRMAPVDLPRARKIAMGQTDAYRRATALVCTASALPTAQRQAARKLALEAFAELDKATGEDEGMALALQPLLPMLEEIDPALVPDLFWRIITKPSRQLRDFFGVARYQPEVAAAFFPTETIERNLTASGGKPSTRSPIASEYLAELASRDPNRAAQIMLPPPNAIQKGLANEILTRLFLIQFLGRPDATRWNYRSSPYAAYEKLLHDDEDIR